MVSRVTSKATEESAIQVEQMRGLMRDMADFVALYETVDSKLTARENTIEEKLISAEKMLVNQLARIKATLADFQEIMTEAGAARWRIAAENALKEGESHLHALRESSIEVGLTLKESCEGFQQAANHAALQITEATNSFQMVGFKEIVMKGCGQIKDISLLNIKRISRLIRSFHWKNVALSLVVTLLVVFLTGLYLDDEWPWELHQQAAKERSAGQTLIAAWSHLPVVEQQDIVNASKKSASV